MPELAEVEITKGKLRPRLQGRRILDFWTDWPRALRAATSHQHLASSIRGRKIVNVRRRGKVIFLDLSGRPEGVIAIHLRMSGRLEVTKVAKGAKERWVHFRWRLSGGRELRFVDPRKFGLIWYEKPTDIFRDPYLAHLGPDPHTLSFQEFSRILRQGRGMIKPFLLRQDRFSGIGNIIADESLWRAKIHPRASLQNLKEGEIRALHRALKRTIHAMLRSGGTTLRNWGQPDGKRGGYYERRKVYGRAGEPCQRCKNKLVKIKAAGRGTTICPRCQHLS